MKRLAIITTHPIQYNAPLFQLLSQRKQIEIKVFYTWGENVLKEKFDPGFGKVINWDIPLLEGYNYEFLENIALDKGSHHFKGISNPGIIPGIIKFKPDTVLVFGWAFKSHIKVMRYFKRKIPVLFRGDSTLLDEISFFRSLKRTIFLRWVYSFVDIALYVGTNNYHYFKRAGLKEKQLIFAPHVIDNQRFQCASLACRNVAKALREKMEIPTGCLVFLFAGKLELKKNVGLLLDAFSEIRFGDAAHLVIIGNGPMEVAFKSSYPEQNIHFMDFQNQKIMPAIYEMADVYVLPSKGPGETWGLAVNEAMANGKAIIASDKCGCAIDLVEDDKNGFIFKSGDVDDLMKSLKKISILKKDELANLKMRSMKAIESFSLRNVAEKIEKVVINTSING